MQSFGYLCTCCGWFNRCVCAASLYDVCIYFFSLGFRSSLGAIREIGFKFPANKHTCISCTRTRLDYKLDRKMVCLTPCIRLIFKTCVSSIIFFIRVYHYMNMSLTQLVFCFELYILLGFFYNSLTCSLLFLIYQRICPFSNDERSNKKPTDNDNNNASNNSNNVDDKNRSI